MKWLSINDQKPQQGQMIIPYTPDMHWDTWMATLTLPLVIWDDEKQEANDESYEYLITHWLPVPEEPNESVLETSTMRFE